MKPIHRTISLPVLALLALALPAAAVVMEFDNTSGDLTWEEPTNWDTDNEATGADTITLPSGFDVTRASQFQLNNEAPGTLDIQAGASLTITGDLRMDRAPAAVNIDGSLIFTSGGTKSNMENGATQGTYTLSGLLQFNDYENGIASSGVAAGAPLLDFVQVGAEMRALGMDAGDFTNINGKLNATAFFFGINGTQVNKTGTPTDATGADIVGGLYLARTDTADSVTLTLLAAPLPSLQLTAAHATPTVLRTSGTVRVHWQTTSADTIVINDGSTDIATFTAGGDGQAIIDAGFFDVAVAADTTFTITASIATENQQATTAVDVLTGGDATAYAETILAEGPVAYWQFEEAAGSSAVFDSTNNGHDSTEVIGGISSDEPGAISSAMGDNGTGAIVVNLQLDPQDPDGDDTAGDVDPDSTEGWSIEAIVRPDSATTGSDQHIAANRDGTGFGRSNFFIDQDGSLQSFVGGAQRPGIKSVADASWCHVVMTVEFDPAALDPAAPYTLRYYIDGVLDAELPDVPIEAGNGDWVLCSHKIQQANSFLMGLLDEVSIWNTTLDQATITAHYDAFIADPNVAPLLGFGTLADSVTQGFSTELFWKLGGTATNAVITDDQGGTPVPDATTGNSVSVSPTVDTVYTLTVNGSIIATATITVDLPILVTAAGINAGGFFEMTVNNLVDGLNYDLFYSDDLVNWSTVAVSQTADATGILTFADTVPVDPVTNAELYYRVELVP